MNEEIWRPLTGYGPELGARYQVSDRGRIRSLDRWVARGAAPAGLVKGRVLKTQFNSRGYECVKVMAYTDTGVIGKIVVIHIAVLEAFVELRPTGAVARHLDGDTANNQLSNLAWGSQSENLRDRRRHGTDPQVNKTECPSGHPYDDLNTYFYERPNGHVSRDCRTCNREQKQRQYRAKADIA